MILLWNNEIVPLAVCLHFMNNFLGNLINNKIPPVIKAKFVFIACDPWQRTPNVQCIYFNGLYVWMTLLAREAKLEIDTSPPSGKPIRNKAARFVNDVEILYLMVDAKRNPF